MFVQKHLKESLELIGFTKKSEHVLCLSAHDYWHV